MSDSGHGAQGGSHGGAYSFQNGVWLSKCGGSRSERFQKWYESKTKSQMDRLDREQHSSLVKLSGDCLEVRKELRSLQNTRRQLSLQAKLSSSYPSSPTLSPSSPINLDPFSSPLATSPSAPNLQSVTGGPSSPTSTSAATTATATTQKSSGMRKSSSSNSLTSLSSGHSSVGSPKAASASPSTFTLTSPKSSRAGPWRTASTTDDFGRWKSGSGSRDVLGASRGLRGKTAATPVNADVAALRLKNLHSARALSKLNNNMDI